MRRDDQAVSTVIGAILVLGVVFGFMAHVRFAYVPVWEEEAEAAHQQEAALQMIHLAGDLVAGEPGSPATLVNVVPLKPSERVLMGPLRFPASLYVETEADAIRVTASSLVLTEQDGDPVAAGGTQYETFGDGSSLTDITRLDSLRLRISNIGATDIGSSFSVEFRDDAGTLLGTLDGAIEAVDGSTTAANIVVTMKDGAGTIVGARTDSVSIATGDGIYFLDVLGSDLQATSLLAAGSAPYDIALAVQSSPLQPIGGAVEVLGGAQYDYAAAYSQRQPDGSVTSVNPGVTVSPFARSADGARIGYASKAQFLTQQEMVIDSGTIVVSQESGHVVRAAPGLQLHKVASDLVITMTVPAVDRQQGSSGPDVALVQATPTGVTSWSGSASSLQLEVTTPYGGAWAQDWAWRLADLGIAQGATIEATVDGVRILLEGSAEDPASDMDRIILRFANPTYILELQ